jgi:beta-galactosidase
LCPLADNLLQFRVDGAGGIAAVDNGNAASVEPFQANHRQAFSGLALVIVRSSAGTPGSIQVTASSEGLEPAKVGLTAAK